MKYSNNLVIISLNAGPRLVVLRADLDKLQYVELSNDTGLDPAERDDLILPIIHVDLTNPVESQIVTPDFPDVSLLFSIKTPIRGELLPPRTVHVFVKDSQIVLNTTTWHGRLPYSGLLLEVEVEPLFDAKYREIPIVDVKDYIVTRAVA